MNYKDNPKFKLEFESKIHTIQNEPLRYYTLTSHTDYHVSRYISANANNLYAESGLTKEYLGKILDIMITAVNDKKTDEVAVWVNNLKYRLKYPVDEHASLRMAMIYTFVDGESPDKCEAHWTEWKLNKLLDDPEAYSFFLLKGLQYTPAYSQYLQEISQSYLEQRRLNLNLLTPSQSEAK